MRGIIDDRPDDDFFTPELWRFSAAAISLLSAIFSCWGLYLVVNAGCYGSVCDYGDGGWGELLFNYLWVYPQIAVASASVVGFLYLVIYERTHRTAINVSAAGLLLTAAISGAAVVGLVSGS